jgi:hypothetical protein
MNAIASFSTGHSVLLIPSVVTASPRKDVLKQEHEATHRMGDVAESRFVVEIFAPHEREYMPESSSDKASVSES